MKKRNKISQTTKNRLRVLVVSDQFTQGGLESHIISQVSALRDRVDFSFSFGRYIDNESLEKSTIQIVNDTGWDMSVKDFINDVHEILDLINSEEIDIVHVHPFHRLSAAIVASNIAQKPIIHTLHGAASINVQNAPFIHTFLQRYFFSEMSPDIITVNSCFMDVLSKKYLIKRLHYIPNSVRSGNYVGIKRDKKGGWAMFSRLDADRVDEIVFIVNNMDALGIAKLDIYGEGSHSSLITEAIMSSNMTKRVSMKGWVNGPSIALKQHNYSGVIGHGQVALEGLAAGLPVLLANTGRVTSLIDRALLDRIAPRNFINNFEPDVSIEDIRQQIDGLEENIDNYILREEVVSRYDYKVTAGSYMDILEGARFTRSKPMLDFWNKLQDCIKGGDDELERFFDSNIVKEIINEIFTESRSVSDPGLLDFIKTSGNEDATILLKNEITMLGAKINLLTERLDLESERLADMPNHINARTVFRNTARRLKEKFRG